MRHLLFLLVLAPGLTSAHGRPPQLERLLFDPNDPDRIVAVATFGLVFSEDGGASWHWTCAAAAGIDPTLDDPDAVVVPDGSIVLSSFDGVVRAAPDLCDYAPAGDPVRGTYVVDLAPDPLDPAAVWGLTSNGVDPDRLVRSEDAGRSWVEVGAPIEGLLAERMAIARSDPARIYVGAVTPLTAGTMRRAFVLRSIDGGASFEPVEVPLLEGERFVHVLAVDPADADRLFVRMGRGAVDTSPERLLYSDDGGLTYATVLEIPAMRGFAMSGDGQTVWVGAAFLAGVWIARSRTTTFEQINDLDVRCLARRGDELWLCVDQRSGGFALGRSLDDGATVEPIVRLDDVTELPACPRCSGSAITCPAWTPDLLADYATYLRGEDGGMTGLPRDAGVPAECLPDGGTRPPSPGCGCRVPFRSRGGWLPPIALALLAARSRRRRASPARGTM